jgi:hypothetical protein
VNFIDYQNLNSQSVQKTNSRPLQTGERWSKAISIQGKAFKRGAGYFGGNERLILSDLGVNIIVRSGPKTLQGRDPKKAP